MRKLTREELSEMTVEELKVLLEDYGITTRKKTYESLRKEVEEAMGLGGDDKQELLTAKEEEAVSEKKEHTPKEYEDDDEMKNLDTSEEIEVRLSPVVEKAKEEAEEMAEGDEDIAELNDPSAFSNVLSNLSTPEFRTERPKPQNMLDTEKQVFVNREDRNPEIDEDDLAEINMNSSLSYYDKFRQHNMYFTGKIISTKKAEFQHNGEAVYEAIVSSNGQLITIPAQLLLTEETFKKTKKEDLPRILEQRALKEIDFVIMAKNENVPEDEPQFVGSRLHAMRLKEKAFWFSRRGRKADGTYLLKNGNITSARIVSMLPHNALVEVYGVETLVKTSELSHLGFGHTGNIKELQGKDTIRVKILEVERDLDTRKIKKLEVSIKQASVNPTHRAFMKIREKGSYFAVVNRIIQNKEKNTIRAKATIEGIDISGLFYIKNLGKIQAGSRVAVIVDKKYPDTVQIIGKVIKLLN